MSALLAGNPGQLGAIGADGIDVRVANMPGEKDTGAVWGPGRGLLRTGSVCYVDQPTAIRID